MGIPKTTLSLFDRLKREPFAPPVEGASLMLVVRDFAVFIDTHRDQPHVGSFHNDIHRGECRPVLVHTSSMMSKDGQSEPVLVEPQTGQILKLHPKHLFVTPEWYETWFVNWIMDHSGAGPLDDEGKMPTSHFRDPREKVYVLKTFGNVVRARATKEGIK